MGIFRKKKNSPADKPKGKDKCEAKNEFRYNNKTSHPNYIFEEKGKKYHAVGLTHSSTTFGNKNMPLKQNPNPKDKKPAYLRNGIISENKRSFSNNPIKNYAFGKEDMKNVKAKVRNYKKRRKQKKSRS